MASSYLSPRTPREARRRGVALGLAIIAHALLIWLLLHVSPTIFPMHDQRPLTTFDLDRDSGSKPKTAAHEKTVAKAHSAARAAAKPQAAEKQPPTEQPPTPTPPSPSLFGRNSPLAGADIGKIKSSADQGEVADSGQGSGRNSGSSYGPGEGPGGSRLYYAQWYRRPSHAEISGYMPAAGVPRGAWGEIACRTVPNYQVENCRVLDESPHGLGIGRSIQAAAWQFRVLPPRIDGRSLIGAWVRIRIDFTDTGEDR
jgi:protein TonB